MSVLGTVQDCIPVQYGYNTVLTGIANLDLDNLRLKKKKESLIENKLNPSLTLWNNDSN